MVTFNTQNQIKHGLLRSVYILLVKSSDATRHQVKYLINNYATTARVIVKSYTQLYKIARSNLCSNICYNKQMSLT